MRNQWKVTVVAALSLLAAGCTTVSLAPIEDRSSGSGQSMPSSSPSGVEVTPIPDSYSTAPGAAPVSALPQAISSAPVNRGAAPVDGGKTHTVVQGDTVYNISTRYGVHPADLCRLNNITDPSQISVGQVLKIPANSSVTPAAGPVPAPVSAGPANTSSSVSPAVASGTTIDSSFSTQQAPLSSSQPQPLSTSTGTAVTIESAPAVSTSASSSGSGQSLTPAQRVAQAQTQLSNNQPAPSSATASTNVSAGPAVSAPVSTGTSSSGAAATIAGQHLQWPAKGEVISTFAQNGMGIDIKGTMGEPIVAALDGTVQYVGSNTKGYGLFLIVRHDVRVPGNAMPLITVYGNTSKILVKINERVKVGQTIALMGNSDSDVAKVRFELRQGKPLDPQRYLSN